MVIIASYVSVLCICVSGRTAVRLSTLIYNYTCVYVCVGVCLCTSYDRDAAVLLDARSKPSDRAAAILLDARSIPILYVSVLCICVSGRTAVRLSIFIYN